MFSYIISQHKLSLSISNVVQTVKSITQKHGKCELIHFIMLFICICFNGKGIQEILMRVLSYNGEGASRITYWPL